MLGRGIRSLLENIDIDLKTTSGNLQNTVLDAATSSNRISINLIDTNPKNPRKNFDEQSLRELADSIRIHDIIQPLTVSKTDKGRYQLIAGERRLRAAKLAGLTEIPAYVRQANDIQLLELALLENLQREDLNAIEISLSYKRMMDEIHYTQEQVAERMGKERSTVTNYLRLLKLPPEIQLAVRNGMISMGHARALININTIDNQLFIFNEVKNKQLSVRQTEELVRNLFKQKSPKKISGKNKLSPVYKRLEDTLASHFSTKVNLAHNGTKGTGNIRIEYFSLEELNKILDLMQVQVD